MHVGTLSLRDFRSYAEVDLSLEPGVNVLLGANGQGKTNIVEALHYLATLSSHRVATDGPLVKAGAVRAAVAARLHDGERAHSLDVEITPGSANKARVNRSPVRTVREVLGLARVVLFAPEDLGIVKGDPSERRRFLDTLLVQRRPRLAGLRADYDRVLKQRTALLKSAASVRRQGRGTSVDLGTLEVWDGHLARTGAELVAGRVELLHELAPLVAGSYSELAPGSEPARATYSPSVVAHGVDLQRCVDAGGDVSTWQELLLEALSEARPAEVDRGVCLVGPHRDDVMLRLGELPARGYASQGESWSMALSLRLASFDLLARESVSAPVLMLDDVFAELDTRRRGHLAERVGDADQVLVTAAVSEDVPDVLTATRYRVADGQVCRDD